MAVFRQYNLQLLPLNPKIAEVGAEGYQRLFSLFKKKVDGLFKAKALISEAYSLKGDTLFAPLRVYVEDAYSYGAWIKFHNAEKVEDLYTREDLLTVQSGQAPISNRKVMRFSFNHSTHVLVIEDLSGALPATSTMEKILMKNFETIATQWFPDHSLRINLISSAKELGKVLKEASGFGKVDIELTFPNGSSINDVLGQLKESNVHHLKASISPERGQILTKIPEFFRPLLKSTAKLGKASFRYLSKIDEDGPWKKFVSGDFPQLLKMRQPKRESDAAFMKRVSQRADNASGE